MQRRMLQGVSLATGLCVAGVAAPAGAGATQGAIPEPVTLGGILNPDTSDTPAFTADGNTVFFDRRQNHHATIIMISHKVNSHWTKPQVASFSGQWDDEDPAVSPDGSYVVFSSNRPVSAGGAPVTREYKGKAYPGGNLWKVEKIDDHWGQPIWLGAVVNDSPFIVASSIAADGTLYFIQHGVDHAMHIFRSQYRDGRYLRPVQVALGDPKITSHDPSVAPDQSFIVFDYGKSKGGLGRLSIAFREGDHWGEPISLGDAVDKLAPWGSHLARGARVVYFTGNAGVYKFSLEPWLRAHANKVAAEH